MTSAGIHPVVKGDAILRMLTEADLSRTLDWRNHPESRRWFLSTDVITPEQHRAWFEKYLLREDDWVFIIDVATVPRAQVSLYEIDGDSAEFGRLLVDPSARGQGLAHEATLMCLSAARDRLGLQRLTLQVRHDNAPALRVYERAGFTQSGRAAEGIVQMQVVLT